MAISCRTYPCNCCSTRAPRIPAVFALQQCGLPLRENSSRIWPSFLCSVSTTVWTASACNELSIAEGSQVGTQCPLGKDVCSRVKPLTLGLFQYWMHMSLKTCFPCLAPWLLIHSFWLSHLYFSDFGVCWYHQGIHGADHTAKLPSQDMWILKRRLSESLTLLFLIPVNQAVNIHHWKSQVFSWVPGGITAWACWRMLRPYESQESSFGSYLPRRNLVAGWKYRLFELERTWLSTKSHLHFDIWEKPEKASKLLSVTQQVGGKVSLRTLTGWDLHSSFLPDICPFNKLLWKIFLLLSMLDDGDSKMKTPHCLFAEFIV